MTKEEDKEFEEASKNMRALLIKKSLREQGIDTRKLPLYKLDEIRRALDKNDQIDHKYQPRLQNLYDEYQAASNKLNMERQAEEAEARSEVDRLIQQIKTDQGVPRAQPQVKEQSQMSKTTPAPNEES